MTQKDRVLSMLKAAGSAGIRSDHFYESHLPRAAARIQELKDAGEPISTTREGKYARYTYGTTELGGDDNFQEPPTEKGSATVAHTPQLGSPEQLFEVEEPREPKVPSAFDPWSQAA